MKKSTAALWKWGIPGALMVVVLVNMYLVYVAKRTPAYAVEERSPYEVGLAFNQELNAEKLFKASGFRVQWDLPNGFELQGDSRKISGWVGRIKALRGKDSKEDFEVEYMESRDQPGKYVSTKTLPEMGPGQWLISLELKNASQRLLLKEVWSR